MMYATVVLMCALALVASIPPQPSSSCRLWCKTPWGEYECCDGSKPLPLPEDKPGRCPPIRICPPAGYNEGPRICFNDQGCYGSDKCCYDSCLRERVCKPAQ
ncbi:uncharacterized protein LOC143031205 [Oratosquilla oratoria]|uniref:uncharacterized protein LOC143031205 n=1 Tax=Oratosquilla oratoria TaxID=337810 RepID=UPI003F768267